MGGTKICHQTKNSELVEFGIPVEKLGRGSHDANYDLIDRV